MYFIEEAYFEINVDNAGSDKCQAHGITEGVIEDMSDLE
jgi:hypothetical protein